MPDEGDLVPTWADFEKAESEMAAAGWRLLSRPGSGFGYPAAVRRDGRLRLHPIPRFPAAGRRGVFIVPLPELEDVPGGAVRAALRRGGGRGRRVLPDGPRRAVRRPARRVAAPAACFFPPGNDHVLVHFEIDAALRGHCAAPPFWPFTCRRWRAG